MSRRAIIDSFPTPLGWFTIAADESSGALVCVHIGDAAVRAPDLGLPRGWEGAPCWLLADAALESRATQTLRSAREQLAQYAAGKRAAFDLPLGHRHGLFGTAFQQRAWDALLAIPFGDTRSYAQQAVAVGNPKAVRAVGAANGQNRLAVVIPCHRVIGAGGGLVGYAGGVEIKKRLLEHEREALVAHHRTRAANVSTRGPCNLVAAVNG